MPTYEYRCKDCGEHIEVVQTFTDDPLEICPNCQGQLRKVFSSIGITFKGSGFYRTDSRKGSAAAKPPKESKEPSSSESKSSESTSSEASSSAKDSSSSKDSGSSGDSKSASSSSEAKTA